MDNRISEIRTNLMNGVYDLRAGEDIRYLLNQLDRREIRKPDSLQFMCDSIRAGRYPNPDDILVLIDELEDSRAAHIKDLEDIDAVVTKNLKGTSPVNPMAARGWSVGCFVKARLERRRNPEQTSSIAALESVRQAISRRLPLSGQNDFTRGLAQALEIVRGEIAKLEGTDDE